jgi:predicted adenine nucleotide alpha hydrolase (AANH) superfamily ATPase
MKKVLLHMCCGVCAIECVERLKAAKFDVAGFFYNPNIHPQEEYLRRKKAVILVRDLYGVDVFEGEYEPRHWHEICDTYETEPEGGKRCGECYRMRLTKTFELARLKGFDLFTTTLTISPHKDSTEIFRVGEEIGGSLFLKEDFKSKDGFKKTIQAAKAKDLYRQDYCGCMYSINPK